MEGNRENEQSMTTAMLKAMANPIRRDLLLALAKVDYARATDLAKDLNLPANSVSFHLRVLSDADLIEESTEGARDKRDRVWKSKQLSLSVGGPEHPVEDEALSSAILSALVADQQILLNRLVHWLPDYLSGRDVNSHGTFSRARMRLTEEQFDELINKIQVLIEETRKIESSEDTRSWDLYLLGADDSI